jgi:hypothetical protein
MHSRRKSPEKKSSPSGNAAQIFLMMLLLLIDPAFIMQTNYCIFKRIEDCKEVIDFVS